MNREVHSAFRLGRSIWDTMDSLPDIRIAVVATTPLEALTDHLDHLISLDMTWGPRHESSVYVWQGARGRPK